ncbi:MAG: DUF4271 domain-containing protein [Bacteroidota bacterium]
MRNLLITILLLSCWTVVNGQAAASNPFEIKDRRPASEAAAATPAATAPRGTGNPFDIRTTPVPPVEEEASIFQSDQRPLLVRRDNEPEVLDARGRTLGIHALLLFLTALLWIFFRPVLVKCYAALFNEGLLSQLYRQRENGQLGIFLICYLLFFLSGSFFGYLLGQAFDLLPSDQPWQYWSYYLLLLALLMLGKHTLLALIAWIFPVKAALGKYNFAIMVFGIIIGMVLIPLNLLISYAPVDITTTVAWLSVGVVAAFYTLRFFRGLLIGNKYLSGELLHFLLYICAVEIAPVLVLYQYVTG